MPQVPGPGGPPAPPSSGPPVNMFSRKAGEMRITQSGFWLHKPHASPCIMHLKVEACLLLYGASNSDVFVPSQARRVDTWTF